jgi:hypothetical protein
MMTKLDRLIALEPDPQNLAQQRANSVVNRSAQDVEVLQVTSSIVDGYLA